MLFIVMTVVVEFTSLHGSGRGFRSRRHVVALEQVAHRHLFIKRHVVRKLQLLQVLTRIADLFLEGQEVGLHLRDILNHILEVLVHTAQEVTKALFSLLGHGSYHSDPLGELMLEQVDRRLCVVDGHLTGGQVLVLLFQFQSVVGGPLVQVLEVLLLVLDNLRAKHVLVVFLSVILDTLEGVRELGEDSTHQELLREGESFDVGVSDIQELRLEVLSEVEVSEVLVSLHHVSQLVILPVHLTARQVVGEADSHLTHVDEVHLSHFFLFLVD